MQEGPKTMTDPFSGGFDPRMFENVPLFRELWKVMSWSGGPVNWDLATQTALAVAAPSGDDPVGERDADQLAMAVGTAELWLDDVTSLPAVPGRVAAFSRADWVRLACSSEGLGVYLEPMAEAMRGELTEEALPPELAGMSGALGQAMGSLGAMLHGVQAGTVAGHLAGQLHGTYDLGVPTLDPRTVGTVGGAAGRYADDYGFDRVELIHWLALREAAHRRQFAGVPWLQQKVVELVRRYAAEGEFDATQLLDQLGGLGFDPSRGVDPDELRQALERPEAFRIEPTPAQRATLDRLQALLAFTQAWVDAVVRRAGDGRLTALTRIEEAARRRRAEQGPGERFLQQLVGLDFTPGDLRAGQAFCDAVIAARGQEGLDRAWQRPEFLPTPAEIADPSRWLVRMAAAELADG
jgi:putative hydrolase